MTAIKHTEDSPRGCPFGSRSLSPVHCINNVCTAAHIIRARQKEKPLSEASQAKTKAVGQESPQGKPRGNFHTYIIGDLHNEVNSYSFDRFCCCICLYRLACRRHHNTYFYGHRRSPIDNRADSRNQEKSKMTEKRYSPDIVEDRYHEKTAAVPLLK